MRYDKWIPVVFLFSYVVRIVTLGAPHVADALVILVLSALYGWRMWLEHNAKPDVNAVLTKRIDELSLEIQNVRNSVNVVKLSTGVKSNDKPSFKF